MLFLFNKTAGNIIIKIGYNVCLSPSWRRNQILSTHYWQCFCLSSIQSVGFSLHFVWIPFADISNSNSFWFDCIHWIFTWNWLAHVSLSLRAPHTHTLLYCSFFFAVVFPLLNRLLFVWHMKQEIFKFNFVEFEHERNASWRRAVDTPREQSIGNCFEFVLNALNGMNVLTIDVHLL